MPRKPKPAKKKEEPVLTQTQIAAIKYQLSPDKKIDAILRKKLPPVIKNKGGRPAKYTLEYIEKCIDEYLSSCWEPMRSMFGDVILDEFGEIVWKQTKPYTLEGFDAWVGWDRIVRLEYEAKPQFTNTLKKLREIVYGYAVESLWKGQPAGVIFNLKNNWGWKDKVETEDVTPIDKKTQPVTIVKNYLNQTEIDNADQSTSQAN